LKSSREVKFSKLDFSHPSPKTKDLNKYYNKKLTITSKLSPIATAYQPNQL
jgi:hypothetical protein